MTPFVMENTLLYGEKWEVPEEYLVELGVANILKEGSDMTIVSHGCRAMISPAAEQLEAEHEISVEVVDLRSIRPLDEETILNSVKKTGRALLVEEKTHCALRRSPTSSNSRPSTISLHSSTAYPRSMHRRSMPSHSKIGKSPTKNASLSAPWN